MTGIGTLQGLRTRYGKNPEYLSAINAGAREGIAEARQGLSGLRTSYLSARGAYSPRAAAARVDAQANAEMDAAFRRRTANMGRNPGLEMSARRAAAGFYGAGTHGITLGTSSGAEAAALAGAQSGLRGLRRGSDVFGRNDRAAHLQRNADFIASGRVSHFETRPATTWGREREGLRALKQQELENGRRADLLAAGTDRRRIDSLAGLKRHELGIARENNRLQAANDLAKSSMLAGLRGRELDITRENNLLMADADRRRIEAQERLLAGQPGEQATPLAAPPEGIGALRWQDANGAATLPAPKPPVQTPDYGPPTHNVEDPATREYWEARGIFGSVRDLRTPAAQPAAPVREAVPGDFPPVAAGHATAPQGDEFVTANRRPSTTPIFESEPPRGTPEWEAWFKQQVDTWNNGAGQAPALRRAPAQPEPDTTPQPAGGSLQGLRRAPVQPESTTAPTGLRALKVPDEPPQGLRRAPVQPESDAAPTGLRTSFEWRQRQFEEYRIKARILVEERGLSPGQVKPVLGRSGNLEAMPISALPDGSWRELTRDEMKAFGFAPDFVDRIAKVKRSRGIIKRGNAIKSYSAPRHPAQRRAG